MAVLGIVFLAPFVCVPVLFSTQYQKNNATRITKLDLETFHYESLETHLFWGQKVKVHES